MMLECTQVVVVLMTWKASKIMQLKSIVHILMLTLDYHLEDA